MGPRFVSEGSVREYGFINIDNPRTFRSFFIDEIMNLLQLLLVTL
jgi:hypothetical protein